MSNPLREFGSGWLAGFRKVGESVAVVVNAVLLSIAYVVGVGPIAVIGKLSRKRWLDVRFKSADESYWEEHVLSTEAMDKYRRQF
jgi:hypothetical protein